MIVREVAQEATSGKNRDRQRPKIIKWKGVSMIRNHSFLATVDEIVEFSKEIDVVKVGIIGDQHAGKSSMSKALGHAIHKKAQEKFGIPFAVRIFKEEDLLNFKETLKTLSPANYVLVFDDVSFTEGNKIAVTAVKNAVTKIRHLEGGQDVKIILIYNYHYSLGFDKYLRQADYYYFLTVGTSDIDNVDKITQSKNPRLVKNFINLRRKAVVKKHWSVPVSPKEFFSYRWRNPFIPALFFNGDSLRLIVSPLREFMDKVCSICATAEGMQYSEIPVDQFIKEGGAAHGVQTFEAAVKLKLFENGMAVYAKSVLTAKRWLDRALEKRVITLEQLMLAYGFTVTKTRLRKQFSSLIDSAQEKLPMPDKDKEVSKLLDVKEKTQINEQIKEESAAGNNENDSTDYLDNNQDYDHTVL